MAAACNGCLCTMPGAPLHFALCIPICPCQMRQGHAACSAPCSCEVLRCGAETCFARRSCLLSTTMQHSRPRCNLGLKRIWWRMRRQADVRYSCGHPSLSIASITVAVQELSGRTVVDSGTTFTYFPSKVRCCDLSMVSQRRSCVLDDCIASLGLVLTNWPFH